MRDHTGRVTVTDNDCENVDENPNGETIAENTANRDSLKGIEEIADIARVTQPNEHQAILLQLLGLQLPKKLEMNKM